MGWAINRHTSFISDTISFVHFSSFFFFFFFFIFIFHHYLFFFTSPSLSFFIAPLSCSIPSPPSSTRPNERTHILTFIQHIDIPRHHFSLILLLFTNNKRKDYTPARF